MAPCFVVIMIWFFCGLINGQTLSPTLSPSSPPTFNCSSLGRTGCEDHTTPPFNATLPPTSDIFDFGRKNGSITHMPSVAPHMTMLPTITTNSPPTHSPVINGRIGYNVTHGIVINTKAPTHSPLTHDFDTNFPSKVPSRPPSMFGETSSPTLDTPAPSSAPTDLPTQDPTSHPTVTFSPTKSPTKSPTQEGHVDEHTTDDPNPNVNVGSGSDGSMTEDELLDLTGIILIVVGILICGIIFVIGYYWYNSKRARKRAKALQFRFHANRQMELDRHNFSDSENKRTNLLDGDNARLRIPTMLEEEIHANHGSEPGQDDIVILAPVETDDPALNMIIPQSGESGIGGDTGKEYLNVNNAGMDEYDGNVTDDEEVADDDVVRMVDKITDNGMEINMNEDDDMEIIDDDDAGDNIQNMDYITAGGQEINMNETDVEESL